MTEETCPSAQVPAAGGRAAGEAACPAVASGHELAGRGMTEDSLTSGHDLSAPSMTEETCPSGHNHARQRMTQETCPSGLPAALETREPMSGATGPAFAPRLHPVLRTAALICWAALAGACGDRSGDPVRAAQAFTAAVQRGDMDAVYPLLERAATERLAAAAVEASNQVGGRRQIEPAEMLQIVDVDPNFELASAELVEDDAGSPGVEDGATARVRLLGSQQESHTLTLVREDGAWRVRIPLPPLTPTNLP